MRTHRKWLLSTALNDLDVEIQSTNTKVFQNSILSFFAFIKRKPPFVSPKRK